MHGTHTHKAEKIRFEFDLSWVHQHPQSLYLSYTSCGLDIFLCNISQFWLICCWIFDEHISLLTLNNWLDPKSHTYLLHSWKIYYTILKNSMWQNKFDRIHSTNKRDKKYLDDLLLPARFWNLHTMETLLSHEATGQDLWMPVKWHNWHWWVIW